MTPDAASPFTLGYALGAICFAGGFILLAVASVASREAIERHVRRALDTGDARVRDFAEEFDRWEAEQTALSRRTR